MRKIIILIFIVLLTISSTKLEAQIAAATIDNVAHPKTPSSGCTLLPGTVSSVKNTGYDVIQNPSGTRVIQVMVWDGPDARFAWNISSPFSIGSIPLNSTISGIPLDFINMKDMDIVIHNLAPTNNVYILITGIRTDGFVGWLRFDVLSGGIISFSPTTSSNPSSGILGTSEFCSNPNIDVNNNGFIGICWSESRDLAVQYDFVPPIIPGGPFTLTVQRSDVFAAFGWIDGKNYFASGPISGVVNLNGDKVNIHNDPGLSEKNEFPDIAVKDDPRMQNLTNNDIIPSFITWSHTIWDMANFVLHSDVKVLELKDPRLTSNIEYILSTGTTRGYAGIPRIAARPLQLDPLITPYIYYDDYQIVFSAADVNCTNSGSRILNWGRHDGGMINTVPIDVTNLFTPTLGTTSGGTNILPVVSYQSFTSPINNVGNYIVTWEHQRTFSVGLTLSTTRDIVSTTMFNGGLMSGVNTVSYVNRRCGLILPGITGSQNLPSMAGRYTSKNGYAFWDNNSPTATTNYIGYKLGATNTPGLPGSGSLRESNTKPETTSELILSPNPTKSKLNIELSNDTIKSFTIYSLNGKLIEDKQDINETTYNLDVSNLASGIYTINATSASGTTFDKKFVKE